MSQRKHQKNKLASDGPAKKTMALLAVFAVAFYPLLVPLSLAKAQDDVISEEKSVSSNENEKDSSEEKSESPEENDSDDKNEISSKNEDVEKEDSEKSEKELPSEESKKESPLEKNTSDDNPDIQNEETANIGLPSAETQMEPEQGDDVAIQASETSFSQQEQQQSETSAAIGTKSENSNPTENPYCECETNGTDESDLSEKNSENNTDEKNCCKEEDTCCDKLSIENKNEATVKTSSESTAVTGENNLAIKQKETSTTKNDPNNIHEESSENPAPENQNDSEEISAINQWVEVTPQDDLPKSSIETEDATTKSTVINVVNTNITSDNYLEDIQNISGINTEDIDLLEKFNELLANSDKNFTYSLSSLEITNENSANISSSASADANTGSNDILSAELSSIKTGLADASAEVINIINRNLVGNSWIFSIINIFGDWKGNLIVPGEDLLKIDDSKNPQQFEVTNLNEADVSSSSLANAQTGSNSISDSKESSIETGDAYASSSTKNIVNTNIVKNNWFLLMINNMGKWTGKAMGWNSGNDTDQEIFSYDFQEDESDNGTADSFLSKIFVSNKNSATIESSAIATANTGNNNIFNSGPESSIKTGAAYANANIFNLINTNVIGNNWMFGIVNVMGTWDGDVIFAYPDLKVSIDNNVESVEEGSEIIHEIVVENIGEAEAHKSNVHIFLGKNMTYKSSTLSGIENLEKSTVKALIGSLKPGEKKTFDIISSAGSPSPLSEERITTMATVSTEDTEKELSNNTSSESTVIYATSLSKENSHDEDESHMKIRRWSSASPTAHTGTIMTNTITVHNSSDKDIYNTVIKDRYTHPDGAVKGTYAWNIGRIKSGTTLQIQYQLFIHADAALGKYTYSAKGSAVDEDGRDVESNTSKLVAEIVQGQYYQNEDSGGGLELVESAEAATEDGSVLGDVFPAKASFPLWILLASLLAYYLALNWAWVPLKNLSKKYENKNSKS